MYITTLKKSKELRMEANIDCSECRKWGGLLEGEKVRGVPIVKSELE